MQAILTKIIPATNTLPTRIKAIAARGSVTVSIDSMNVTNEAAHKYAADRLCAQFLTEDTKTYGTPRSENPWARRRVIGCLPSGDYCHVFLS